MKNIYNDTNWSAIRAKITSIEFHKDGIEPVSAITSFDVTDSTSDPTKGNITLYAVDDGLGNNTYKAIIVANDVIYAPENSCSLFDSTSNMKVFNSNNFRVDNVKDARWFFWDCASLLNISTLSDWNVSNVTKMNGIFNNSKLSDVDALLNWNVSSVTDMNGMFANCTNLNNVNGLSNWNTSNVTNMSSMFFQCSKLNDVKGIRNWNVEKVETMRQMFTTCINLENIDLSEWKTTSLNNMNNMFGMWNSNGTPRYDSKLKRIILSDKFDTSKVTTMAGLFANNTQIEDIISLSYFDTQNVENMSGMFAGCSNLVSLDLSSWDMSKVTNDKTMFERAGIQTLIMPNNYTRIDNFMFNQNESYSGESFTIPKTVTNVGNSHIFYNFGKDSTFKKFIVENGSTSLKTIDDVLYSYDGTRLISIPRGKTFTNNTYEMPEGLTFMNELSFSRNQNIDTVILPNSYVIERYIDANNNSYGFANSGNSLSVAVYRSTNIKRYEVKADNSNYLSDSGCIYSKDGTELIAVPFHYNGVLNIKEGTITIGQEAFWYFENIGNDLITQINIPASVTTIETNQLSTLNTLMSRSTNPVTITIDSGNTSYQIVNNQIVAI